MADLVIHVEEEVFNELIGQLKTEWLVDITVDIKHHEHVTFNEMNSRMIATGRVLEFTKYNVANEANEYTPEGKKYLLLYPRDRF